MGERRWKRKTVTEFVIISVVSIIFTVFIFVTDFDYARLDFPVSAFPFIGGWVGFNVGEILRMSGL